MYLPKHFRIEELVPPQVFKDRGQKAWQLLDSRLLIAIDLLRDRYGQMTINNWVWNGDRKWSGLRTSDSPYYSQYSQHCFGRAADIIFADTTAEEVRQDILADATRFRHDETFGFITSFEEGTSWLHVDVRNVSRVLTFPVPLK